MRRIRSISQLTEYMGKYEVFYNINISLKNKYIYFETAKAACTTIKRTLMNLELENTGYRPKKVHLKELSTPFIKPFQLDISEFIQILYSHDYFKFCFVRNPYIRTLSCYLDKIAGNNPHKKIILNLLERDDIDNNVQIEFEEFVDAISMQKPKDMNQHWRIQYFHLFGDLIHFDFIGKVETFAEDFKVVDSRIGGKLTKHFENVLWHETGAKTKITEYYTDAIAEKVKKLYSKDFEKFGYSTDWHAIV